MQKRRMRKITWALALAGGLATSAMAEEGANAETVGSVAAVSGELRLQRSGTSTAVPPATRLSVGDRLSTGPTDRAKLIFDSNNLIDIAPATELVVERYGFDPGSGRRESSLRVLRGKIRARLGEGPLAATARDQVETATAVMVRGSDYIVTYDPDKQQTEVVGIRGEVDVVGRLAIVGGVVKVGPQSSTTVLKGRYPVSAARVSAERYQELLGGLAVIGTGQGDGLAQRHAALSGRLLDPADLPPSSAAVAAAPSGDEAGLAVDAPREFLGDEMSADFRVHDQPLLEYDRLQPGLPLPADAGGVRVEF